MSDLDPEALAEFDEPILEHLRDLVRAHDQCPADLVDRLYALVPPPLDRMPSTAPPP